MSNDSPWPPEWPVDNKPTSFYHLSGAVREAVDFCYTLRRKNSKEDVPWNGPPLPEFLKAQCHEFHDALTADKMEYQLEGQDRDAMDVIIGIAMQLGMEQGRRSLKQDIDDELKVVETITAECAVPIAAYVRDLRDRMRQA